MTKQEFLDLLDRYLAGKTSAYENDLLLEVYRQMEDKSSFSIDELKALDELEDKLVQRLTLALMHEKGFRRLPDSKPIRRIFISYQKITGIAASLLLVAGMTIYYFASRRTVDNEFNFLGNSNSDVRVTYVNRHPAKERVVFSDSSYVDLSSGSSIVYDKSFSGGKRSVYLKGKGFFQVTKNHAKPFIVYTDRLVTKVLGTSFEVNSYGTSKMASVTVMTGRVAVFRREDFKPANEAANLLGGILITPNHTASLTNTDRFQKGLSPQPAIIADRQPPGFEFDNTPVAVVLSRMETAYGIHIIYDPEKFRKCSLSVKMGRESFFDKLELVCHTLDFKYHVQDGDVYIEGEGCGEAPNDIKH